MTQVSFKDTDYQILKQSADSQGVDVAEMIMELFERMEMQKNLDRGLQQIQDGTAFRHDLLSDDDDV